MSHTTASNPIPEITKVGARARQPNIELLTLLASPMPLSPAQWERVRQFENAADWTEGQPRN